MCNLSAVLLPRVEVMNIYWVLIVHRKSWPLKKYDKNQEYNENVTGSFVHICQAKFNTDLIFVIHTLVFQVNVLWKWQLTHLSKFK